MIDGRWGDSRNDYSAGVVRLRVDIESLHSASIVSERGAIDGKIRELCVELAN